MQFPISSQSKEVSLNSSFILTSLNYRDMSVILLFLSDSSHVRRVPLTGDNPPEHGDDQESADADAGVVHVLCWKFYQFILACICSGKEGGITHVLQACSKGRRRRR